MPKTHLRTIVDSCGPFTKNQERDLKNLNLQNLKKQEIHDIFMKPS